MKLPHFHDYTRTRRPAPARNARYLLTLTAEARDVLPIRRALVSNGDIEIIRCVPLRDSACVRMHVVLPSGRVAAAMSSVMAHAGAAKLGRIGVLENT
jgi:hypothetical protein